MQLSHIHTVAQNRSHTDCSTTSPEPPPNQQLQQQQLAEHVEQQDLSVSTAPHLPRSPDHHSAFLFWRTVPLNTRTRTHPRTHTHPHSKYMMLFTKTHDVTCTATARVCVCARVLTRSRSLSRTGAAAGTWRGPARSGPQSSVSVVEAESGV